MTRISEVLQYLETIAPLSLQEDYDNAGLITGSKEWEVQGVLTCLDSTEDVVEEAISLGCNVIVAHHPIIFRGLKRITDEHYVQRVVSKAIKHDIAIYAIHTNLDNVFNHGVNSKICDRLNLRNRTILNPKDANDVSNIGSGMIGELELEMDEIDFLALLKERMKINQIKHTSLIGNKIKRVALCGGSGSFLLNMAIRSGADIFITSDFKYHEFFDADGHLIIADIGHYESEFFTIELLFELLREKFSTFALHFTKVNTNPVNYY